MTRRAVAGEASRAAPGLFLAAALCLLQGPGLVHRDVFKSHAGLDDPCTCPTPQPPCQMCAAVRQPGTGPTVVPLHQDVATSFVGADLQVGPPSVISRRASSRAPPLI